MSEQDLARRAFEITISESLSEIEKRKLMAELKEQLQQLPAQTEPVVPATRQCLKQGCYGRIEYRAMLDQFHCNRCQMRYKIEDMKPLP